jgi:hypothetical protein
MEMRANVKRLSRVKILESLDIVEIFIKILAKFRWNFMNLI